MAELERLVVRIEADLSDVRRDLSRLRREMRTATAGVDRELSSINRSATRAARGIGVFASSFAGLGGVIGAAGIAAALRGTVSSFAEFESGLVGIGKTTGIQGEQLQQLGADIQALGQRVPVATAELLEIGQAAGQLGVTGTDNILKFTETVAKLGLATDLSGGSAAATLARILNVTDEGIDTIDRLGSVITRLGNEFAATEAEIAEMTIRIAQTGQPFGISSANAAALGTALKALGQNAELAGTQLGVSFVSIEEALRDGGDEAQTLARILGRTQAEIQSLFREDVAGFTLEFARGLRRLSDQGESIPALLADVGIKGARALSIFGALSGGVDQLERALATANDELERNSALNEEAAAAAQTFNAQMQLIQNAVNSAATTIGQELAPEILALAEDFRDFIREAKASGDLKAIAEGLALAFRGLATVARELAQSFDLLFDIQTSSPLIALIQALRGETSALSRVADRAGEDVLEFARSIGVFETAADRASDSLEDYNDFMERSTDLADLAANAQGRLASETQQAADAAARSARIAVDEIIAEFVNLRATFSRFTDEEIELGGPLVQNTIDQLNTIEGQLRSIRDTTEDIPTILKITPFLSAPEPQDPQDRFPDRQPAAPGPGRRRPDFSGIGDGASQAGAAADDASDSIERLKEEIQGLIDRLDPAGAEARQFEEDLKLLETALTLSADAGGITREQFEDLKAALESEQIRDLRDAFADLRREIDPAGADIQDYRDRLDLLKDALDAGIISLEEYTRLLGLLNREFVEAANNSGGAADGVEEVGAAAEIAQGAVRDLGLAFTSAFEDAIVRGASLSDILRGLEQDILRVLTRRLITEPILEGIDFGLQDKPEEAEGLGIGEGIAKGIASAKSSLTEFGSFFRELFSGLGDFVIEIFSGIDFGSLFGGGGGGGFFGTLFSGISTAFGFAAKDGGLVPDLPKFAIGGEVGNLPKFGPGGMIRGAGGPTSDQVPILASAGEFVVNAKATRENRKLLEAINSGLPKFAVGGLVEPSDSLSNLLSSGIPLNNLVGGGNRDNFFDLITRTKETAPSRQPFNITLNQNNNFPSGMSQHQFNASTRQIGRNTGRALEAALRQ